MKKMKLSLRHLIIFVALLSVVLTLVGSLWSGYHTGKHTLITNALETNRVYAQKLAETTDLFLKSTLQTLQFSSTDIAPFMQKDEQKLLDEANRLKMQNNTFNSIIITNAQGEILATSPQSLQIKGKMLVSPGGQQALKEKKPLISKPYTAITGRLVIFISHPIFDKRGNYLGLVGGTLYLKESNILYELLGKHFYQDGSYVYVVDGDGRIIYHENQQRVNDVVVENPVVQKLIQGKGGAERVINTKNQDMIAGYSYIPIADWGVVSQRPADKALAPATEMLKDMIQKSLPLLFLSLLLIWWISRKIAQPLHQLAYYTENSTENSQEEHIEKVVAWYYEAIQLKKSLLHSLVFLHDRVNYFMYQSTTDPLTKLANRRTMEQQMQNWAANNVPFSIIILDIDHFKRVNDTYGHPIGDEVLKFLAEQMKEASRQTDICCRFGGEEFVILLPHTEKTEAFHVAERLRMSMESSMSPCGEVVTISVGISSYPACTSEIAKLIEQADECLYSAKKSGRNRTIVFEPRHE
ncbi:sensor domain-containing diguanylate cyclase [Aneurinibacillus aneurinilyticus]|jgi:diguanylate cyclase (GGDEF)-like protein|uniref:sensor domain-containing diguanylate cyclase n=1 Tax=Aneurinibacillus aneurinilyticus TaxID=1391 RepID=UPI0023F56295|nr:sensor domain-containing diguanylate cyclase [Aneurinibacillus aneurinilyticus]MCI1696421.1 sensor domain-containing diguanylate cyclase [Aneurinibacillus aneurinilyticus]